jgi:cyclopropane fatty-acyl-phospholipid synthase-like methyltransferase
MPNKAPVLDPSSLERIVPDQLADGDVTGVATLDLHMARYRFAAGHLVPGTLLDIACGVGYGTHFLVSACPKVRQATGVDLSDAAIDYASSRYADPRIRWKAEDAMCFHHPEGFNNIVSLETIEHLPHPEAFFRRIAGMLRPGGMLVASVPSTPSMDGNPHHLADFSERSFRRLARGLPLREVAAFRQEQPFLAAHVITGQEKRSSRSFGDLLSFYLAHPGKLTRRVAVTARYGFVNRYLTIAWVCEP